MRSVWIKCANRHRLSVETFWKYFMSKKSVLRVISLTLHTVCCLNTKIRDFKCICQHAKIL